MLLVIALLFSSVAVDARVTFAKSEVLDNVDLKGANAVAPFRCSNGCRVYSPTASDTIAIFDGTNQQKSLLDLSNDNKGFEFPGGNYQLKNTGLADQPFVFFAVEKGAANYGSPVFYRTTPDRFIIEATETGPVTILSGTGSVTFSNIAGFSSGPLPSVYASGFDSISSCSPIFTASSPETLWHSFIPVHSPIATIDIKKGAAGQSFQLSGADSQYTLGWNAVYVSPGYVGCPAVPSVGESLYSLLPNVTKIDDFIKAFHDKGIFVDVHGDYNIAKESDAFTITINNKAKKLYGKNSISDMYDGTQFNINVTWTKSNDIDRFAIQIDMEDNENRPVVPVVKTTTPGKVDRTTSVGVNHLSLLGFIAIPMIVFL